MSSTMDAAGGIDGEVWVRRYALRSLAPLNRHAPSVLHHGALVRVGAGVGCLHPWTSLGDAPLEDQLESIVARRPTRLARRTLECIRLDGAAREAGVSLFDGLAIPPSHRTIVRGVDEEVAGAACLKLKAGCVGGDGDDRRFLVRCVEARPGVRLRIDFNGGESAASLDAWWDGLPAGIRDAVDFLEDPVPWDEGTWHSLGDRLGVALALDREVESGVPNAGGAFQVAVVKPAIHDPARIQADLDSRCRMVITSYMDHPIGQCFAAFEAARWAAASPAASGERHGLLTHRLFEPNPFIEAMRIGPDDRLAVPPGTGLGFDELVDSLPWTKLR